jgi:hypothetical protein
MLGSMKVELPQIRPEEQTPLVAALVGIIQQLADRVGPQDVLRAQLRAEIARRKGQKPRPTLRPSLLERAPAPTPPPEGGKRPGSAKRPKTTELTIHHEQALHLDHPPEGATFRRYEPYVVHELVIQSKNTRYLRARYDLPTGGSVRAPFPVGVLPVGGGHFGAHLVAYILDQYHQAQVTEPLLLEQLWEYGSDISAGQLHRLLTEHLEHFHQEKDEVRAAGLAVSSYLGTDDTGARHQGKNGYCTVIGNDLFAIFESSAGKSRLNCLQVRHGRHRTWAMNETTLAYWERQQLAAALVEQLTQGPQTFAGEPAGQARLTELGIVDERHVRIATEGALLGGLVATGVASDLVVLSDGAPQFDVLVHASCWIHAERPLVKLVPYNDQHRALIEQVRGQIWDLSRDLKAYRAQPDAAQRPVLEARFDTLVQQRTGYPSSDGVLKAMRSPKADLLRVLERPEVPLHNNARESDIREFVKRRKIRGGTRNDAGRRCRDTFARLKKPCRKLGVRFWDYLHDRIRGRGTLPRLAELIRQRAATATKIIAAPG